MAWIDRAFINKDKGLLTFADLRRRSESEAKREERRKRRKNKRRNRRRGGRDESTLVGASPDNDDDEGYIDNDTGSVAAPSSEPKIPPTFCTVSPENVLQPGSSRRKGGKSETESRFPGSERSSSSAREENRR